MGAIDFAVEADLGRCFLHYLGDAIIQDGLACWLGASHVLKQRPRIPAAVIEPALERPYWAGLPRALKQLLDVLWMAPSWD
jgi:hypothetical protein